MILVHYFVIDSDAKNKQDMLDKSQERDDGHNLHVAILGFICVCR